MAKFNMPKREPTTPGEMLQYFIEEFGINQSQLAKHLGWTAARVNEIVKGKRGITIDAALAFADAFGNSPEFWLNCQQKWELWHALRGYKHRPRLEAAVS